MAAQATDIRFPKAVKVTGEGKEQLALALNLAFIGDFPQGINPTPEGYLVTNSREIIELRTGPDPDWSPLQTSDFSDVAEFIMEWLGKLTPDEQQHGMAAYAAYVINATQFVLKLRAARLQGVSAGGFSAANAQPGLAP